MRKTEKVKAIVIRSKASGEKDRVIKLLCSDGRFINAVAKGAQSLKSKHRASCMLFCLSEFVLTYTGDFAYVSSGEVINGFRTLQHDVKKISAASYFCQSASFCESAQSYEFDILYRLLGYSLTIVDQCREECLLTLAIAFGLKLCAVMGIAPHFESCVNCGDESEYYFFSETYGGIVCPDCINSNMTREKMLTSDEARYLKLLMYIDIRKISTLDFSALDTQKMLLGCVNDYVCDYFHRKNNSYDMLIGLFNE